MMYFGYDTSRARLISGEFVFILRIDFHIRCKWSFLEDLESRCCHLQVFCSKGSDTCRQFIASCTEFKSKTNICYRCAGAEGK